MTATVAAAAAAAREWLYDAAFPFWFERGIDREHGGFIDLVEIDGGVVPGSAKRTLVQGRQVYAFAMAGRLGWAGQWREAVETGLATIDRDCRHPAGGFIHSLDSGNRPAEQRRDLYDQAFVATAEAYGAEALGDPGRIERARAVFAELDRSWRRWPAGYREGELPNPAYRRQNPHMHLFEAALAIRQSRWGNHADLVRCEQIAGWFARHFFDRGRGLLPEYFDADWGIAADEAAQTVEPGHHFEWLWLLAMLKPAGGSDLSAIGERLWHFAQRHGIDRTRNVAVDELGFDGRVKSARARLWPQTERLKAAITMRDEAEILAAFDGLQPYLATPAAGACYDKMRPEGGFEAEPSRASSLYHIVCAYAELLSLAAPG
ncbi:MAG TPA: AGE family epimerase/isomerase [Stellaceae bacterium]|jgi:mannose-6-phosphate isomerase